MLIQFKFTNFKSFRDTAILDLSATKVTEYPHHVVEIGSEKILRTAAIYGANASGKTNICDAFNYMVLFVRNSFGFGGTNTALNAPASLPPIPFRLDSTSSTQESSFEVYFTLDDDDKTYNYGFSVNRGNVTEEWLHSKSRTGRKYTQIYYRGGGIQDLSGLPKKYQENIRISLQDETLILSLGAKLRLEKLEKIFHWFGKLVILNFGDPTENMRLSRLMPAELAGDTRVKKELLDYLSTFDGHITDFFLKEKKEDPNLPGMFDIWAVHTKNDSNEPVRIPLMHEAAGTQKMFSLFDPIQHVLKSGGVLCVDELDDRLHPLLLRSIIQTFLDPERNPQNAQLIFTTHDTWLLSASLLRRDEIWFTQKDASQVSHLYSLVDFKGENDAKVRKDADYETNYLLGKYGGIPDLTKMIFHGEA